MTDKQHPFWLVWNPKRDTPSHKHELRENAIAEAERLARKQPGEIFYVLETVEARVVDSMQRVGFYDPELPF